jgi:DNA-binding GntR family transcriptional regulator
MVFIDNKKELTTRIWEFIFQKTHCNGNFTSENELCKEFSISRTQLRDVLKELEVSGIIERRQRKGITIKQPTLKEVSEIYDAREAVEGMASRLAAINASKDDIKELESIIKAHNQAVIKKDTNLQIELDIAFHSKIIEMSGNQIIIRIIEQLMLMDKIFRMAGERDSTSPHSPLPETHEDIIEAIREHDSTLCEKLVKGHIRGAKQRIINKVLQTV